MSIILFRSLAEKAFLDPHETFFLETVSVGRWIRCWRNQSRRYCVWFGALVLCSWLWQWHAGLHCSALDIDVPIDPWDTDFDRSDWVVRRSLVQFERFVVESPSSVFGARGNDPEESVLSSPNQLWHDEHYLRNVHCWHARTKLFLRMCAVICESSWSIDHCCYSQFDAIEGFSRCRPILCYWESVGDRFRRSICFAPIGELCPTELLNTRYNRLCDRSLVWSSW